LVVMVMVCGEGRGMWASIAGWRQWPGSTWSQAILATTVLRERPGSSLSRTWYQWWHSRPAVRPKLVDILAVLRQLMVGVLATPDTDTCCFLVSHLCWR